MRSIEAQAADEAYAVYVKWEGTVGRVAASAIALDTYRRIYAELVRQLEPVLEEMRHEPLR